MVKDKMLYDFDKHLDEVYGKPGSPRREAFRKNVTAYREMIEKVDKELGMEKIETEEQRDWAEKRVNELADMMDENTPIHNRISVELELLTLMIMDYDEEHGYSFDIEEEVEKAVSLRNEYFEEKKKRTDWNESFANYAKEGEDEMMLPDSMDSEADELMDED